MMDSSPTMIIGERYRFTLLTSKLIRMEYDPEGVFENRPAQMVQSRIFPLMLYQS